MTELFAASGPVALAALIVAAIAIVSAIVATSRAAMRAAAAEGRLKALCTEIEAAIGNRIDWSAGRRWRDQVSAELKRIAGSRAAGPCEAGADWIATAGRAIDLAAQAVAALEPESEPARIAAALGLAERLAANREGVGTIANAGDLEGALVSGTLNDVLTTAPLLAGYFGHDAGLIRVIESYLLAASALRLALAEVEIFVETPAVLSIVWGRQVRGESMDGRELRRIPQARTLANRLADKLTPGENLIVYCSVPGWTAREKHRPAAVVFWNSASWLV
jgi:hypothetical protein